MFFVLATAGTDVHEYIFMPAANVLFMPQRHGSTEK